MKNKSIKVTNPKAIAFIKKSLTEKEELHNRIRTGQKPYRKDSGNPDWTTK